MTPTDPNRRQLLAAAGAAAAVGVAAEVLAADGPGKERIPAELKAGRNVSVIETGDAFFLSVTDDDQW